MGVKKKHEHESGFFEENLIEPTKSNRNDWMPTYRNQPHRSAPQATQQINGTEPNYLNKPMEFLEISRGCQANNKNYNHYSPYEREKMSSTGDSKSKKHSNTNRNRAHWNQIQSSSNAASAGDNTIVISDEEDDSEDNRSQYTHNQVHHNGESSQIKSVGSF